MGWDVFDWDEYNSAHIMEHGVSQDEAEDAVLDPRRTYAAAYDREGEERRAIIGATSAGRVLFVVVTRRGDRVRVVTARDAIEREKKRYRVRGK